MIRNMMTKTRYWILAGLMAAMVSLSGGLEAQAQGVRIERGNYGDGWTHYDRDYRWDQQRDRRSYDRDYGRGDRYYRSYYRGYDNNYYRDRGYYYNQPRYRGYNGYYGNGVRVGPVQVWW